MSKAYIVIQCDGSSIRALGGKNLGKYGAILKYRGHEKEIKGRLGDVTNNHAELLAVIHALETVKKNDQFITIYTDSQWVARGFSGEYKVKFHLEDWKEVEKFM